MELLHGSGLCCWISSRCDPAGTLSCPTPSCPVPSCPLLSTCCLAQVAPGLFWQQRFLSPLALAPLLHSHRAQRFELFFSCQITQACVLEASQGQRGVCCAEERGSQTTTAERVLRLDFVRPLRSGLSISSSGAALLRQRELHPSTLLLRRAFISTSSL